MHFVYILHSAVSGKYYCGESADMEDRLERHNQGRSKATKAGVPWTLVKLISVSDRKEAVKLEGQIEGRGIRRWLESNG
ncbi:MAG: GIY-YIG nuclease family protein [Cryomorphaceae bacterium]|nr:GIY-YIG nuclease family protein [Flavobacteriales bacterium]